ncbi:hypothetical protein GJ496_004045 [Pomphorhynchus laevis]|nr:hypothetical protein GJ496_004045 [Pomphorhynchus laevis]
MCKIYANGNDIADIRREFDNTEVVTNEASNTRPDKNSAIMQCATLVRQMLNNIFEEICQ